MSDANLRAPRPVRIAAFVAAGLLQLALAIVLVRAFAPGFTAEVANRVMSTFTVTVTAPEPTPTPTPTAAAEPEPAGAAAPAGRKATPREAAAPKPRIVIAPPAAPPVASTGSADRAGAADAGAGSGAGGQGDGTGSGGAGSGTGGGGGTKAVKIAGDINSARDYPIASREARIGSTVTIWLTVGKDGRPSACRVVRPSRDPAADAITCRLAMERFRFRPATDASGAPAVATYGWQQRWFLKE